MAARIKRPIQFYCKCYFCEEMFPIESKNKARPFCKDACRVAFSKHEGKRKAHVMNECMFCGDILDRTNQKYCSVSCKQKFYYRQKLASGVPTNKPKEKKQMGNCLVCETEPLNRTNQKYCSNACRQRAYNLRKAG